MVHLLTGASESEKGAQLIPARATEELAHHRGARPPKWTVGFLLSELTNSDCKTDCIRNPFSQRHLMVFRQYRSGSADVCRANSGSQPKQLTVLEGIRNRRLYGGEESSSAQSGLTSFILLATSTNTPISNFLPSPINCQTPIIMTSSFMILAFLLSLALKAAASTNYCICTRTGPSAKAITSMTMVVSRSFYFLFRYILK